MPWINLLTQPPFESLLFSVFAVGPWHRHLIALINEREVIEKILRHLGLWEEGVRVHTGTDPPGEATVEPWLDDPFPDYDTEPVIKYANG